MATGVTVLNSRSFDELVLASEVPVLVEVGADWCSPCRVMAPVLASISGEYAARLMVLSVDADADPAFIARFDVRGLPTMLLFQEGQLVKRLVGARSKHRLLEDLAEVLS